MPKYIDADIAWKRLEAAYWEDNGDRDMAEDILDALPAADVAPVVRCRKCKNRNTAYCPLGDWTGPQDDFYCSYGALMDRKWDGKEDENASD